MKFVICTQNQAQQDYAVHTEASIAVMCTDVCGEGSYWGGYESIKDAIADIKSTYPNDHEIEFA